MPRVATQEGNMLMCTTFAAEVPTSLFLPQAGSFGGNGTLPLISIPQREWYCPNCYSEGSGNTDGKTCPHCGGQMTAKD